MSLLRSVLKKKGPSSPDGAMFDSNSPLGVKNANKQSGTSKVSSSAASFRSVATAVGSIKSFYTLAIGGSKTQKRRRPDILTFGAPNFYHSNPPPSEPVEGVERVPLSEASHLPFTAAHAVSVRPKQLMEPPRLSLLLFSHAAPQDQLPMYHDQGRITGEVRISLTEPTMMESMILTVSLGWEAYYLWTVLSLMLRSIAHWPSDF